MNEAASDRLRITHSRQQKNLTNMKTNPPLLRRQALTLAMLTLGFTLTSRADTRFSKPGHSESTVYIASNAIAGNEVLSYVRDSQGQLRAAGHYGTGGKGTGAGLGNQGGLVLTGDGRFLLVINAATNDISTFSVGSKGGLHLVDRTPSGGVRPLSIAVSGDLVYVLNGGGAFGSTDNVTGFHLNSSGRLSPLTNSTRSLSTANAGPAQISFSPEGDVLLVTEKTTGLLTTFAMGEDDRILSQQSIPSTGATPFGFSFSGRGKVFVANAAGGVAGAGSVSSYFIDETASALNLAAAVPNGAGAPCWLVVNATDTTAYVANTGSNSISVVKLGGVGSVTVVETVTTGNPSAPADEALTPDGDFLYVRNGGNNTLGIYAVSATGGLTARPSLTGLPAGANGLATRSR